MAVTKEDLRDFTRFADEKLDNGGVNSLVELASEWESQRRELNQSVSRIDAHTVKSLTEAFPDVEDTDKLRQALGRRGGVTTTELLEKATSAAKKADQG